MNYFAHALPFLDSPYFAAGTAVPDWLNVVDRRVRCRSRHARAFCENPRPDVARLLALSLLGRRGFVALRGLVRGARRAPGRSAVRADGARS